MEIFPYCANSVVKPREESTQLFAMLFIRKLPSSLQAQLSEDEHSDLPVLAEKADRIIAMLARQKHDLHTVAAVSAQSDDERLAAMISVW